MRKYTTKQEIENYLLTDIDSTFDTQIDSWIESVSKMIEGKTNRIFTADTTDSDRLFRGINSDILIIDDCISVSKVYIGNKYGSSFTEITDFIKIPLNDIPYTAIQLKQYWGNGIHKVKAKWGYSVTCPEDIKFVATVITAGIINNSLKKGTKQESIGDYAVTYEDDKGINDYERAIEILNSYKRYYI